MPAISAEVRGILWIIVGVSGLLSTFLTYVLKDNLSYFAYRIFGQNPGNRPPRKPFWLWLVYIFAVVVFIIGTAFASAAPNLPSKPEDIVISTPVKAGEYAQVSLKTDPGAHCELTYTTPIGNPSKAQGLGTITADGNGLCAWRWLITARTEPGSGTLTIKVEDDLEIRTIEIIE